MLIFFIVFILFIIFLECHQSETWNTIQHPFCCRHPRHFKLQIGTIVKINSKNVLTKWNGQTGKIVEYVATRTYGIILDSGEYVTAWAEDFDVK